MFRVLDRMLSYEVMAGEGGEGEHNYRMDFGTDGRVKQTVPAVLCCWEGILLLL